MDKRELQLLRGEQARQLLTNPVFEAAFTEARASILEAWAELPTSDKEAARDLHRQLKCLDRVRKAIQTHIDTGTLARKDIETRSKVAQFADRLRA